MSLLQELQEEISKHKEEMLAVRRHLHMNPELSYREHNTSSYIAGRLESLGIPFRSGIAGTGLLANLENEADKGKTLVLRAELDALPIQENTGLPYSSRKGTIMHACGHDAHMAMLLGAAHVLQKLKHHWKGRLLLLFQPGEEQAPGGASLVMDSGIFEEYKPDLFLAQHAYPEFPAGHFGFRPGTYMASSDELFFTLTGTGGHAALVQTRTEQTLAQAQLIRKLYEFNTRPDTPETVLAIGKVEAGGATNVMPQEVRLSGTFRTFNEEWRALAHEQIRAAAEETAREYGITIDTEIRRGYPAVFNHENHCHHLQQLAEAWAGAEKVHPLELRMSSEDFAFYGRKYPSVLYRLGVGFPGRESAQLHNPGFTIDETALPEGMGFLAFAAIQFLK